MHHGADERPCFAECACGGRREGVHQRDDGGAHAAAGNDVGDEDRETGFGGQGVGEEEVVGEEVAEGVGEEDDG